MIWAAAVSRERGGSGGEDAAFPRPWGPPLPFLLQVRTLTQLRIWAEAACIDGSVFTQPTSLTARTRVALKLRFPSIVGRGFDCSVPFLSFSSFIIERGVLSCLKHGLSVLTGHKYIQS